jgi:hypothetical protein
VTPAGAYGPGLVLEREGVTREDVNREDINREDVA